MQVSSSPQIGILSRVVRPESGDWTPSAAKALLKLSFAESDRERMRKLLAKNQITSLTGIERQEMDAYEILGHLIDLIHSKARRSIKKLAKE